MEIITINVNSPEYEYKVPDTDMNIIEYLYVASWNDIIFDEDLMGLIVQNGFYKEALCDAQGIDRMIIKINNEKHKLYGPADGIHTIDLLENGLVLGTKIVDSSQ
jgi:hypothetical protein